MMVDWTGCKSTEQQLQDAVAEDGILIYWHLAESRFGITREKYTSSYKFEMKRLCKCTRGGDILYAIKGVAWSVSGVKLHPLLLKLTVEERLL